METTGAGSGQEGTPEAVDRSEQTKTTAQARRSQKTPKEEKKEKDGTGGVCSGSYSDFKPCHRYRSCACGRLYLPIQQDGQGFSSVRDRGGWPFYQQRYSRICRGGTTLP